MTDSPSSRNNSASSLPGASRPQGRGWWGYPTAILLIAAFFRFFRLADHPLGIFFDPAITGLDAIRLMQRGGPVIFFPTNGGREAPFMYVLALFNQLFGTTPFAIRFLTAIISLLTVAALIGFLRHLQSCTSPSPTSDPTPLRFGNTRAAPAGAGNYLQFPISNLTLLASLSLAVSYWHISISRLGQRPILAPMVAVFVFWPFLAGWYTGHPRSFVLSGLALGLAAYTYSAARLLPVIIILALLPEFVFLLKRRAFPAIWARLIQLGILGLTAAIISMPMAWYMVNHPAQFTARASTVMVWHFLNSPADIIAEMGQNVLRVAGFFCCAGSLNPIFGLPGYPGLSLLLTPFLLIGLLVTARQWRSLFHRMVAVWWLVGIAPSIFAIEAPHPLRMIIAIAPTAILVGLGLQAAILWVQNRFTVNAARLATTAAILLILLPTPGMFRAYFVQWTELPVTRGIYDYGAIAIRDEVLSYTDDDLAIYLPFSRSNDSTLLYYLSGTFERQAALSVPPSARSLAIAPEHAITDTTWVRLQNHTATLLPPMTAEGQQLFQAALTAPTARAIRTVGGEIAARLASLPTDPVRFVQQPTRPITATFGPVKLIGATYEQILNPAAPGWPVTLYWQANQPMTTEYEVVLQLVDDRRRVWADGGARPADWVYPTTFWRPGLDTVAARHVLTPVSADPLPPGRYWLVVAFFDPSTKQRLPLTAGQSDSPNTIFVGPLKAPLPPPANLPDLTPVSARFGEVISLAGFAIHKASTLPGQAIEFTLLWETLNTPALDYTVFTHLLDMQGNLVAGFDTQPVNGTYPTTIWKPGERVTDPHILPVPDTLPPGQYRLAVGLYHQPTGQRLPLYLPEGQVDLEGRLILNKIIIIGNPGE